MAKGRVHVTMKHVQYVLSWNAHWQECVSIVSVCIIHQIRFMYAMRSCLSTQQSQKAQCMMVIDEIQKNQWIVGWWWSRVSQK